MLFGLFSGLPAEQETLLKSINDEILSNVAQYSKMSDFNEPVKKVEVLFLQRAASYPKDNHLILRRALVAKLTINLPKLVNQMALPASILSLYPAAIERLASFLKSLCSEPYDSSIDFFRKDIRFILGLSVPCGAQVVDMNSRFRMRTVLLSFLRSRDSSALLRYFLVKGYQPWFQIHTESRYLEDFTKQGWERCYLRVAELLVRKKHFAGMVGTSWFYDPRIVQISQRLAHLQECPRNGGAFFLRHGTQSSDIENAIKTSETRRRLYHAGKYIPICYSMLWPRRELIAWATKHRTLSST